MAEIRKNEIARVLGVCRECVVETGDSVRKEEFLIVQVTFSN